MPIGLKMNSGTNYLETCTELDHYRHNIAYTNHVSSKAVYGKNEFPEIKFHCPNKKDGTMLIKIAGRQDEIARGEYSELLAVYSLVCDLKDGSLECKFCKRKYPDGCSVVAFLNLISKETQKTSNSKK